MKNQVDFQEIWYTTFRMNEQILTISHFGDEKW